MSRTFNLRSISYLCYFTILLLVIRNHVGDAVNRNTWTTDWVFKNESKCEKKDNCLKLQMEQSESINLTISNLNKTELIDSKAEIRVVSDADILHVANNISLNDINNEKWTGVIKVDAIFIGKVNLFVEIIRDQDESKKEKSDDLSVIIVRKDRVIDTVFIVSVASLVSILYINFGAALDLRKVKNSIRKPIGNFL